MIKPDELHEYMLGKLTAEQRADKAFNDIMSVIVMGIIKAVESKR